MATILTETLPASSNPAEAINPTSLTNGSKEADITAPKGLKYIPPQNLDPRTDAKIALYLQTSHPVTSEKNVWYFWHTGWNSMKPWVQRGIIASVRRLGKEWTVHFTDNVKGSKTHISKYIDEEKWLPRVFWEGGMEGRNVGQFQGDMVRLPLLLAHGGVWMDAGMILFRHLDDICWKQIADPNSPFELAGFVLACYTNDDLAMANGFFAAKAGNPFLRRVYEVYRELWAGGARNSDGFHRHELLRHLGTLGAPNKDVPFAPADLGETTDYLSQTWCIEHIRHLISPAENFHGPEYWSHHVFAIDMAPEMWRHQITTNWSGRRQFDLLSRKRTSPRVVKDAEWNEAEELVQAIISDSAVMKLSAGSPGTEEWWLAGFWNKEGNEGVDIDEGTFAAYLRWASWNFDQTRELVPVELGLEREKVWYGGVLEPVGVVGAS